MLSNIDLENLAIHYKIPLVAICMKDELQKTVQDGNYIINLESSKAPDGTYNKGSHWMGMIIQGNKACFCDSFGAPPAKEICDYIKRRGGCKLAFNNWDIQDLKSENCGYYSLSFLMYMRTNIKTEIFASFNGYVNLFGNDTIRNDAILKNFYLQLRDNQMPKTIIRLLNEKIM